MRPRLSRVRLRVISIKPRSLKTIAVFKFKLSERATVVITVTRKRAKPLRIRINGVAGLNSKKLKRGKLKRGSYTATLVAIDAGSNKSAAKKIKFRIV